MNLEEEIEKMTDLLFEYNIAKITNQDEDILKIAKTKYKKQFNKVMRLQKLKKTGHTDPKKEK